MNIVKTTKKNKILVLLDAHAILHRAYHALPPLTSPDGMPTGALYGFASMLLKIIRELKPDYIAACYDMKAPTFRHVAFEAYKGKRAKTDDELIAQFDVSRQITRAFGIPVYEKETFEADDIIGTIVEKTKKEKNLSVIIASGDLDTLQLVEGKRVRVYTLRKGIQDTLLYDEDAVRERFGFAPALLPDFKGLKGDPSDNIAGVRGIGDKTASLLIKKFGTLENILAYVKKSPQKLIGSGIKERAVLLLEKYAEDARFSKELASIKKDVPISFALEEAEWKNGIQDDAAVLFQKLGFASILSRMRENTAVKKQGKAVKKNNAASPANKSFWKDIAGAKERYWALLGDSLFIVTEKKKIRALAAGDIAAHKKNIASLFTLAEPDFAITNRAFDAKKIFHFLDGYGLVPQFTDDLFILFWLSGPERADPELKDMIRALCPDAPSDADSAEILSFLPAAYQALEKEIKEKELEKVYREIEMPLTRILFDMEKEGVRIEKAKLSHLEKKAKKQLGEIEGEIHALAGTPFNINSSKELASILFDTLGISAKGIRKTGTGKRSTKYSELVKLKDADPIIEKVMLYRELGKLYSTYISVLPELVKKDGRIHTTFHQTGTVTGRLSSSDPNLQNIPLRRELSDEIRRAFVPGSGYIFFACDYSQIQLRIAAMLSGEERMLSAFRKGDDIHRLTATRVFGVEKDAVTPEMRRRAKVINFGILYGMGARALAENIGVSQDEADLFLNHYFAQFPNLFEYFEKIKREARANGYVQTLFGRKRFLSGINSGFLHIQKEAERMAVNMPIQGTEADIMKKAMIEVSNAIRGDKELRGNIKMILQIHDELLFEVKNEELNRAKKIIPPILENVYKSDAVDFVIDVKTGPSWGDLNS
ncbi:MAG: DNA polymerase I [Candidatus Niyogibacteria bacterium]|nr:DNA polymerase I [Candidatus Niyogibacteria bacterium]